MSRSAEILSLFDFTSDPGPLIPELITRMDTRRKRTQPMSVIDVVKKVYSIGPKPGEMLEIFDELFPVGRVRNAVAVMLEVADIVYYTYQPNCPLYLRDPSPFFEGIGVTRVASEWGCVVKYTTRMSQDTNSDPKSLETVVMGAFLDQSPQFQPRKIIRI